MFVCLCIRFQVNNAGLGFFSVFTSTQRKLIHNIYSELAQKDRFVGIFPNTFLFPEKSSAVTSWSAADIKTDFQNLKKKPNKKPTKPKPKPE